MTGIWQIIAGLLVVAGSAFALIASIGIMRLPDVYSRMHAASKAGAVGAAMTLLALAILSDDIGEILRALAAILFVLLTAPLAAHLLARAAYSVGYPLWSGTVLDEMPDEMRSQHAARQLGASENREEAG